MIDFNTEPYNDDFEEGKKFYRILYRPSFAVQARELTQMQTILQNQIKRHGDAIFKQGAMVIPGQASVETVTQQNQGSDYIKLVSLYSGVAVETFLTSLKDQIIIGSSGVKAQVIKTQSAEESDPTTLYVRYLNSGNDGQTKTFSNSEVIQTEDGAYSFQAASTGAVGKGSLATVKEGVYYINGHFCLVEEQTIILEKYSNSPTYRVGLDVSEKVITPEEDETLLDNAQNSYNFAAPGAHRYYIELILIKKALDDTDDQDFVELIRVNNGTVDTIVKTTEYSLIGKELARRTYDESGDYTVKEFAIDIREHRNNDRGAWAQNTSYLIGDIVAHGGNLYVAKNSGSSVTTAPTHTTGTAYDGPGSTGINWEYTEAPAYNRGIYLNGDETKLAIGLEAGKAYVRGYEIEKDSTTYLPVSKSREYAQAVDAIIPATVGNYVLVKNVNNLPPVDSYDTIRLYDQITGSSGRGTAVGNNIGTARIRFIEWHTGLPFNTSSVYKLGLFDVQMNNGFDFNRDVKSFYYSVSGDPQLSFSADIDPVTSTLSGSVSASGGTLTGVGTSFQTDLSAGDYIVVDGQMVRITANPSSQEAATVPSTFSFTGKAYSLATTEIVEPGNNSLLFPLPYYAVRSMRQAGTGGINDTSYTCYQKITQTATGTSVTFSISGTFASYAETDNYIFIDNDATAGGEVFTPDSVTPSGSNLTVLVPSGRANRSISVIAAVVRSGSSFEKTKTLTTATPMTLTSASDAKASTILLEHADVFRLISVKMASGFAFGSTPEPEDYTTDITDFYEFDDGQRTTHYDLGRLILKASYSAPNSPIRIQYEYFEHGVGDYFDVNSYTNIDYKSIPANCRDAIDFRPRVANKSAGSTRNFIGTGSSLTSIPKRGIDILADFSYYLARKDKIAIDFNGKFFSVAGVSSLNPGDPQDPALGMVLYNITLEPYTFGTKSNNVNVQKLENKRYTMRDIGKLETRINNLEYYTSLSLLEQETQSLKITDEYGLDRTKNGFIVDNFTGNNIGNVGSPDYYCSIDMNNGELRPFYTMKNVNLLEKNSTDIQRDSSNYQINGDVITLPIIANKVLVKQEYASRLENINPFAIFTFLGNVSINPPSDDWFETNKVAPDIINVEGNYNLIRELAIKSGTIQENGYGTVWGAWKDEWIGQPISQGTRSYSADRRSGDGGAALDAKFGVGPEAGGWAIRQVVSEVLATPVGQSRTGIRTKLATKTDYQQVGERVVSTATIPYIRSRNILVQVKGMKPETRFYPFFDDIDISSFVTPSIKMVYTAGVGVFDTDTNVGGASSETKRRINGDSQVCLNRGDVITNSLETASAVVISKSIDPETDTLTLELANVKGTFAVGQSFSGSVSGATGTVVSVSTPTTLVSNKNGEVNFLFNIPNTDSVRFRTGSRELKLVDTPTVNGQFTSRGRGMYRAQGVLETKQSIINAVRNAELVKEVIGPNDDPEARQTIYQTSERVVSDTGWYDPLAQSFLVQQKGGAFLTKIDVFFATKDVAVPVSLEIREMVNGYPGKNILPFSRVTLKPEVVNAPVAGEDPVAAGYTAVTLDNVSYADYNTATSFTFETPVYVQDNAEYCFVLLSDSNNYKVWISNVGDTIPGTSRTISEQPYAGVMFKSQNASTWTADQNQDIKFSIYRAQFDTSVIGNVEFVNDVLPYVEIENDPFQTAVGSTTVRVWHKDHGMTVSSRVVIDSVASAINGIPASEFNKEHLISNVDMNSYTIATTTAATSTGYAGGLGVRATANIQYDVLVPSVQMQTFSDTNASFSVKTTSGKSVDGGETPYVIDTGFSPCLVKDNNYFYTPRVISSEPNENSLMSGNKSLTFSARLQTSNDAVSPVIDTARTSLIAISNKINSPSESNVNVSALDVKQIFSHTDGVFNFTAGGTITSTDAEVRTAMAIASIGKYITIAGATTGANNKTVLITGYADDGTTGTLTLDTTFTAESSVSGTTVSIRELFLDDISPNGSSSLSKYVTSAVKLENVSTNVRVKFAANIPNSSDVLVYYKTCVGDKTKLTTTKYTLATPDSNLVKVQNGNESFYDCDYTIDNMAPFDNIVVKIVMKSTNSSAVPRIKDLRVIACA